MEEITYKVNPVSSVEMRTELNKHTDHDNNKKSEDPPPGIFANLLSDCMKVYEKDKEK